MEALKMYIGGKLYSGHGRGYTNFEPANGNPFHTVSTADPSDFERVLESSRQGQKEWAEMMPVERGRILRKTADLLRLYNDELAELEARDTGKPISETLVVDIVSGADCLEYFGGIAAGIEGEYMDLGGDFAYIRREPLGVCGGIGAWNYPLQIACWKSAPALACGNSMIFKPSEMTPVSAVKLAEIYSEAGLPDGVFNVIHGDAEIGKMMVAHPDIAKISLTGEVGTGKAIMKNAAHTLKHITLELGGKSPIVVFDDADIEEAVYGAMLGNFYTQGEICSNGTRVYVHKSVKKLFIEKLVEETRKLKIGNPLDPKTQVGALISEDHFRKVMGYIDWAKINEVELIIGGERFHVPDCKDGYFVEPTVFVGKSDDLKIVKEEIFGPVMTILEFEEEDEVIERANNTPYGLSAGVFTRDLRRGHRVSNKLEAGICWINTYNITPVEIPFGGYKNSGLGRENGWAAIDHYTQRKTVYVAMEKMQNPFE
ncbi:betaine-aldehyde dehydrogenase [Membranihabitans maritimus]|uniref:betaine-aldehyde dehydrogenase n=1 Tax=Membranihabitans maritimus TaxID=2904244 RepID=UPI001EFF7830|nr:betaine-aldehyde dehydrogenase [Membranihabitans maritimus]